MSKPDDVSMEDWDAAVALPIVSENFDDLDLAIVAQAIAAARAEGKAQVQCCACGKKGLSTAEGDGGTECQLDDGRWTCSQDCYDRALGWDCEPVAWMHPTAGWVHHDKQQIAMHCSTDGPKPVPLVIAGRAALASLPTAGDGKGGVE